MSRRLLLDCLNTRAYLRAEEAVDLVVKVGAELSLGGRVSSLPYALLPCFDFPQSYFLPSTAALHPEHNQPPLHMADGDCAVQCTLFPTLPVRLIDSLKSASTDDRVRCA